MKYIVSSGYSEVYGARNLKRKVQESVEDKLADSLINSDIKSGDYITIRSTPTDNVDIHIISGDSKVKLEKEEVTVSKLGFSASVMS